MNGRRSCLIRPIFGPGKENRPPRGALAVVVVGLLATVVATLLSTTKILGPVAIDWEFSSPIPSSAPAEIPGGGSMRIEKARIVAIEPNIAGYRIFRVSGRLRIEAGSAVGQGRVICRTLVPDRAIPAKTPGSRASYPRSTQDGDLSAQNKEFPERVVVEFSSHGTDVASLELEDAFDQFVDSPGVTVSWPSYSPAVQEWQWGLPDGKPERDRVLAFSSFWRTTVNPAATITCRVETANGEAETRTAGRLTDTTSSSESESDAGGDE